MSEHLTFEAERTRELPRLRELLRHDSAVVREGAIYGMLHALAESNPEQLWRELECVADDPSPGIQAVMADILTMSQWSCVAPDSPLADSANVDIDPAWSGLIRDVKPC